MLMFIMRVCILIWACKILLSLGMAIGAGMQGIVAIVNLVCFYVIGIPMGALLGYLTNLQVKVYYDPFDHHKTYQHYISVFFCLFLKNIENCYIAPISIGYMDWNDWWHCNSNACAFVFGMENRLGWSGKLGENRRNF